MRVLVWDMPSGWEPVPCWACRVNGCGDCNGIGYMVFNESLTRLERVMVMERFDGRTVLARKLPDGRLQVIGELVDEEEWRRQQDRVMAESGGDDADEQDRP